MMSANAERLRRNFFKHVFDRQYCFARSETGPVADPEYMGIDSKGFRPESGVHYHIGGLTPDPRQSLERIAAGRHFAFVFAHQYFRQGDYVLRLAVKQPNSLDMRFQPVFAKRKHLCGRRNLRKQFPCCLVHADIGRLCRTHNRDQQLIDVAVRELGFGRRICLRQPPVKLEDVGFFQRPTPVTLAMCNVSAYCWKCTALPSAIRQTCAICVFCLLPVAK